MRRFWIGLAVCGSLAGCVGYGPDGGYGGGYGGGYAGDIGGGPDFVNFGDPGDAYYDGYYGPVRDGFWGHDRAFHFDRGDHHFMRDGGGHFRRAGGRGFQHVHFAAHGRPGNPGGR